MKILYVINSGKPGGMEQHVLDLVEVMKGAGNDVHVWCLSGEVEKWYLDAGAIVVTSFQLKSDIDPLYILKLRDYIVKNSIDVVHAHELKASSNSLLACIGLKVPVVTHIHTPMSEWRVTGLFKKVLTRFQVFCYSIQINLFGSCEIALTPSRYEVKSKEGINKKKLVVIPNCIKTEKFTLSQNIKSAYRDEIRNKYNIPKNAFVFGNISRLTVEKGHALLLKAFKKFLEMAFPNTSNLYLLCAGGGELAESLKELTNKYGISDKVIFTGIFPEEDKVKYYSTFDLFVFPSLAEGFGLVLMEAMYFGLPVLASDLKVLQEVGGDTISYFKTSDTDDLSKKMLELYSELSALKETLPSQTSSAHDRVDELYTREHFYYEYSNLYKLLLTEKATRNK